MKSMYRNMMLVAAAAMSLASCSKDAAEETAAPAPQTKTVTVTADITRTQFGGDRTRLAWSKNDEFGVYTDVDTDRNIRSGTYGYAQLNNNGEFSFKVDADATEIYAYYPFYFLNNEVGNTAVYFGIPNHQKWNSLGVLTGKYIPMVASGAIEGSSVNLSFEQLGCVLALNVYGGKSGETLSSITLNTKEPSCGEVDMDIAANPVVYTPANKKVLLTPFVDAEAVAVDAAAVDNQQTYANQVYLVVAKKEYAAGAEFIVVTSEKGYTFTTQAPLDCTDFDFMAINFNLKSQTPEPVTVSYKVIIRSRNKTPIKRNIYSW